MKAPSFPWAARAAVAFAFAFPALITPETPDCRRRWSVSMNIVAVFRASRSSFSLMTGCIGTATALIELLWVGGMEKLGFAVSTGSACASGKEKPSHILITMGVPPSDAGRALRFSAGWETTREDWAKLLDGVKAAAREMGARDVSARGYGDGAPSRVLTSAWSSRASVLRSPLRGRERPKWRSRVTPDFPSRFSRCGARVMSPQ